MYLPCIRHDSRYRRYSSEQNKEFLTLWSLLSIRVDIDQTKKYVKAMKKIKQTQDKRLE